MITNKTKMSDEKIAKIIKREKASGTSWLFRTRETDKIFQDTVDLKSEWTGGC